MAEPAIRVEIGLDLPNNPSGFKLDDPVQGRLDNTLHRLAGFVFYNIADRISNVSVRRGKSQSLDRIDSGLVSITADNSDRLFDPLYEASLFYGILQPRREVRIYSNDIPVFFGFIDDFDIDYSPPVGSNCVIKASDAFSQINKAKLAEFTPTSELPGERINTILSLPEVNWPVEKRDIETGSTLLLDTDIAEDTNVLDYLQLVTQSEFGNLFMSADGNLTFRERNSVPTTVDVSISDEIVDGEFTGIPFIEIQVVYGSEFLYNRIVLTNSDIFPEEAVAEDEDSQTAYGILTYSSTGLLVQNVQDLEDLATSLLTKYAQPQYRFESVSVDLSQLDETNQNKLINAEIDDIINVRFIPSGVPPAIDQFCRIIGISQNWSLNQKRMTFSLEKLDFGIFILDSPVFGILDEDRLAY
jgi:hypothetical protein